MTIALLALALGGAVIAHAATTPRRETGARDWRADVQRRNDFQRRKDARQARRERPKASTQVRTRRPSADCCAAPSDDWRASRAVYDRWRPDTPVSYREALAECWQESVEAAARGDYSKPASRRCALGKMHAAKRSQWQACREGCHRSADPFSDSATEPPAFDRYAAGDGSGGVIWTMAGVPDTVRVSPSGDGQWRVDISAGGLGPWRLVDIADDELVADQLARDALDVPF